MNQEQYELFFKLLEEFHSSGVLGKAIIPVGSWCMVLYRDYFRNLNYRPNLRTRDVDFLVDTNNVCNFKIDLSSSLERLNFMEKRDPTIDGYSYPHCLDNFWKNLRQLFRVHINADPPKYLH